MLRGILKRIWLVILVAGLVTAIGTGYSYKEIKPSYVAKTSLLVQLHPQSSSTNYNEQSLVLASQQLVPTFIAILQSDAVVQQAFSMLNTQGGIVPAASISVTNPTNTSILNISVKSSDASVATALATNLTTVFQQKTQSTIGVQSVDVVDSPKATETSTNRSLYIAISLIIGLILGCLCAAGSVLASKRIRDEDDVLLLLQIPVLGRISEN